MVTGVYPFNGDTVYTLLSNIGKGVFEIPNHLDDDLKNLIGRMLERKPSKRLSFAEIAEHPWLAVKIPPSIPLRSSFSNINSRHNSIAMSNSKQQLHVNKGKIVRKLQPSSTTGSRPASPNKNSSSDINHHYDTTTNDNDDDEYSRDLKQRKHYGTTIIPFLESLYPPEDDIILQAI